MRTSLWIVSWIIGFLNFTPAHAQEGGSGADPETTITRYQDYLARKPYHDWGFDKLCEAAIQINRLPSLIREYEERVASDPTDETSRVILARLLAKNGKLDEARDQLSKITKHDANYQILLGGFLLKQNAFLPALDALDEAAKLTKDEKQLRDIHKRRGEAALATGDRIRAVAAFKDLAELEPKSFNTRLEAAKALAEHALAAEALEQLAVAETLAGDDAGKRCQVLSETGRLHERLNENEKAIAVYDRALPLMARGNWLKKDVEGRLIAIHKRSGTLDRLIARARERAAADRQDVDSRLLCARALEESGQREAARDELRSILGDYPEDLAVSRQLLAVLDTLKDVDGRIAEMQRILEKKPDELEIYIDLGRAFASAGRLEQARLQWNKTLEKRLRDPQLCVRIGALYAYHRMLDDAIAMYEKAIALEPAEVRHYSDLAALLSQNDLRERALAVLARAEERVADSPSGLEELAQQYRELGDFAGARQRIERALQKSVDDSRLLSTLADLLVLEGDRDRASEILHHLIDVAKERAVQSTAVGTILRMYAQSGELDRLMAIERTTLEKDPKSRSANLVLGKVLVQSRQPDRAIEVFERLIAADPESEIAREQVGRLLESAGDLEGALARYQELIEKKPASRRQYLKEIARIHLALYDQDEAFRCYEEILKVSPDNPAAFVEVADAYQKLGLFEKQTDCLKQAVRLKPDDARNRLKLAEALHRDRENDAALEQVEAALVTQEPEILEDARRKYYALLSETGRLEATMLALRKRCEENPYDSESPIRLTDLYSRELEYELALELLDRLIQFQPREIALRRERARILVRMERYDDAILDYESLLTEDQVDRDAVQTSIAEAAFGKGDLDRAKSALALVNDPFAVARTFDKADLLDEAQAALEKGLERSPRNEKLLRRLAKVKLDAGDKLGSIAIRERLIESKGDSFRELLEIGRIYHQVGRKDDALGIGKRLFALIRIEEKPEEDEEDDEKSRTPAFDPDRSFWTGASAVNQQYADRVREIYDYFQSIGASKDFTDVGIAEMELQPTNLGLLETVLDALREQERGMDALALIGRSRAATVEKGRIPEGYTRRSLAIVFEVQVLSALQSDAPTAEARLAELDAIGEQRTAQQEIERTQILDVLHRDEEALSSALAASQRHRDEIDVVAQAAAMQLRLKAHAEAIPLYERVLELLERSPRDAEEKELYELSFVQAKSYLLQSFPVPIQKRVGDDVLRRLYAINSISSPSGRELGLGSRASRADSVRSLAVALSRLGRNDEARARLRSLTPSNPEALGEYVSLGTLAYELDLFDLAEEWLMRAKSIEEALSKDPLLGFSNNWTYSVSEGLQDLARILEKRGEALEAYELLRRAYDAQAAELILTSAGKLEDAESAFAARLDAREASLDPARYESRNEYRDAGVLLAGLQVQRKRYELAIATYRRLLTHLQDDVQLMQEIANLEERAGNSEATIAMHRAIIEKKRELNLRPLKADEPPGKRTPVVEIPQDPESWTWSNLRGSNYYYGYSSGNSQRYSMRENHAAILKIHLDRKEIGKATDVMREIARDDVATYRWLADSLGEVIGDYNLGKDGLPILRMLYGQDPSDGGAAIRLAEALVATEKDPEAQKILSGALAKVSNDDWSAQRMRDLLQQVEERLGRKSGETLEDLQAKVDADPKNVKQRVKLARRYLADQRFTDAHSQIMVAEKLAPHLDEVRILVMQCKQAIGDDAGYEERIRKEAEKAKDNESKFRYAVMLADRAYEAGRRQEIDAIFERAIGREWGGTLEYAPSSWWLEKHEFDEALKRLDAEIEEMDRGNWGADQARSRRAWLVASRGQPFEGLNEPWKQLHESTSLGSSTELFRALAGAIAAIPEVESRAAEFAEYLKPFDPDRQDVLRLAFTVACRKFDDAEAQIGRLVGRSDEFAYLYPLVIHLKRMRGDREGALALLTEIESKRLATEQRLVWGGVGQMTELDALLAEKGSLLLELGKKDEAIAVWRSMFEETDEQGRKTLASILAVHELYPEAIATLKGFLAERGEREYYTLTQLAGYHEKLGEFDAALAVLDRARVLAGSEAGQRNAVFDLQRRIHRKSGSLGKLLASVEAEVAIDPNDIVAARQRVQLAAELGDHEKVRATLDGLKERPDVREWIHRAIAEEKLQSGDPDGAIAALREHVEGAADEWRRTNEATRLAQLLVKRGDMEAAIEVSRKAQKNPYGFEAKLAIGTVLKDGDRPNEALPFFDEAVVLDPRSISARITRAQCVAEAGDSRRAVELTMEASELPTFVTEDALPTSLLAWVRHCGFDAVVRGALENAPDDALWNRRAAIIAYVRGAHAEAESHVAKALASRPDDLLLLSIGAWSAPLVKRFDLARERLKRAMTVCERLIGLPGYDDLSEYTLSEYRSRLGDVDLREGNLAQAVTSWRQPIPRRYRAPEVYRYAYYNTPVNDASVIPDALYRHGFDDEFLKARAEFKFLERWNPYGDERDMEVRFERGEHELAIDMLLRKAFDPASSLMALPQSDAGYYYPSQDSSSARARFPLLVRIGRELGSLDSLLTRVREQIRQFESPSGLKTLERELLSSLERYDEIVESMREDIRNNEFDPALRERFATALIDAKRYEEARKEIERAIALHESARQLGSSESRMVGSVDANRQNGRPRFAFSGSNTGYVNSISTWSSYDSSSFGSSAAVRARARLVAVLIQLGQLDQAAALEAELVRIDSFSRWRTEDVRGQIARHLFTFGKFAEGEKRLREVLAEQKDDPWGGDSVADLLSYARRYGSPADVERIARERLAEVERDLALDPSDESARLMKSWLLAHDLGDPRTGLDLALEVARNRPSWSSAHLTVGAIHRILGEGERAVLACEVAREQMRLGGSRGYASFYFEYGRSLITAGRVEEGRKYLLRALAIDPKNPDATEVRALLN